MDYLEKMEKSYCKSELNKIDLFAATHNLKITDFNGNETKYLGINSYNIDLLIDFLTTLKEIK